MEARVVALESNMTDMKAVLARIEAELAGLRRDLRENEIPALRAQLSRVEGALAEKPSSKDMLALTTSMNATMLTLSANMNATLMRAFQLSIAVVGALLGGLWFLHKQGIL